MASSSTYHNINDYRLTHTASKMASTLTIFLYVAISLLMIDAAIEMAFLSSMVYWLHYRAGGAFDVTYNGTTFSLHGKPVNLLTNQGHTSNGAAGTAFFLVGCGGLSALWARGKSKSGKIFYHFWRIMTMLSGLLALAALIYTFVLTAAHAHQTINPNIASGLHNRPYPNYVAYPLSAWTPENWFAAVLRLSLASARDVSDVKLHLAVVKGWRWNLIPLFLRDLVVCGLAFVEGRYGSRTERVKEIGAGYEKEGLKSGA